jgi:hypothetical protein
MADLKQTIIEYMKDFHVEADLTIEELAEDIMADVDEAYGICPWCGFPVITKDGEQND